MNILFFLFKTSRYRFWLYLGGTYLIGYAFGASAIQSFMAFPFWLFLFYFLIPANIFLYGVNDYYDEDTDQKNPKKGSKEHKLVSNEKNILKKTVVVIGLLSVLLGFWVLTDGVARVLFGLFLFLSLFYSALPLRFKAHPMIDAASNILYGIPGFLGYYQVSGIVPPLWVIVAVWCWTAAMHLFSAIPDIAYDKKAQLQKTAVVLGKDLTLIVCLVLWSLCSILVLMYHDNSRWAIVSMVYPLIPLFLLYREDKAIKKMYWFYPILNAFFGFCLFSIAIHRLYG